MSRWRKPEDGLRHLFFICGTSAQTLFGKKEEGRAWANAALSLAVRATETVATSGNLLTWWSQMKIVSRPRQLLSVFNFMYGSVNVCRSW